MLTFSPLLVSDPLSICFLMKQFAPRVRGSFTKQTQRSRKQLVFHQEFHPRLNKSSVMVLNSTHYFFELSELLFCFNLDVCNTYVPELKSQSPVMSSVLLLEAYFIIPYHEY